MRNIPLKIKFCAFILLMGLVQQAAAQEGAALRDMEVNPTLFNAKNPVLIPRKSAAPPLTLPFFEDFSSLRSPFPNDSLWEDNMVFINTNFPLFPPTIGVATFDALDANGQLYEHAEDYLFGADTLTSRPIRMDSLFGENPRALRDALTNGDTTAFFSFYFQPGGGFGSVWDGNARGRAPGRDDLLILEFLNEAAVWTEVWNSDSAKYWSLNDRTLESFCPLCVRDSAVFPATETTPEIFRKIEDFEKTFFKQVAIPITNPAYLYNGFQFRFRNLSSLDQNYLNPIRRQNTGGQWHVDYIRLDVYPNEFSDRLNDIAFVNRADRVLRDFQAMPAKQFQGSSDLVSEIPLVFRNLSQNSLSADYQQRILNQAGQVVYSTTPSTVNIFPFFSHGFRNSDPDLSRVPLFYDFPSINSPETFIIQHILKQSGGQDIGIDNDTMTQTVHFGNYFAYDDGTSEATFGFIRERERSTSQFAYRFPMRVPDTLVGIQIWFNPTKANMNRAFFNVAVWSDTVLVIDGHNVTVPGQNPIYVGPNVLPIYNETIGFVTYWLDSAVSLNLGDFFIGFQQHNNHFLNIGFDQNNNAEGRMFQKLNPLDNSDTAWRQIFLYGSVMMRPVFGTSASIPTNILEREPVVNVFERIRVFPNPSNGTIFVESPENVVNIYEIYDLTGRRLLQRTIRNTQFSIELPEKSGVYILVLHTEKGLVSKKVVRQ